MTPLGYWRSTTAYRVRAALNLKGLACVHVSVDLVVGERGAGAYLSLNPGAAVPTLVLEDGTVLTQALAIIDYLDAIAAPRLLLQDPLARARATAAAHTIAMDVHPVNNLRVTRRLRDVHGADAARAWMTHWTHADFAALERQLAPDAPYAFGDPPDLADLCIVAQAYNARRWGVELDAYPGVGRVEAACLTHPAIAAAHPDVQHEIRASA